MRAYPIGEADRVLVLLTRGSGQVRCVAKGVRRTSSKFGSRLAVFNLVDFQAFRGRSLDTVTQVETIASFAAPLAADYESFTAASVMAETACQLTADDPDTRAHHRLLHAALGALVNQVSDPRLLLASYLLRALGLAGWAPALGQCVGCGTSDPLPFFTFTGGGAVCTECAGLGSTRVGEDITRLLAEVAASHWQSIRAEEKTIERASRLASAYTQYHLEQRLKSVPVWERGA